jgi:thiamine transport system permease protein
MGLHFPRSRVFWGGTSIIALIPLGFLVAMMGYPLLRLVITAFYPALLADEGAVEGVFITVENPLATVLNAYYVQRIAVTLWQAFLGAFASLLIGVPLAVALWVVLTSPINAPDPWRDIVYRAKRMMVFTLQRLVFLPFILPVMVVVIALRSMPYPFFGVVDEGILPLIYAYVFYNLGVVVWMVTSALMLVPPSVIQSAQTLGSGFYPLLWHVILPSVRPAIQSAGALVFLFCASSFGVALIFGGQRFATIEVEIYQLSHHHLNLQMASLLALMQFMVLLFGSWWVFRMPTKLRLSAQRSPISWQLRASQWLAIGVLIVSCSMLVILPLIGLLAKLVAMGGENIVFALQQPLVWFALQNSLIITGMALPFTVLLAVATAYCGYRWHGIREPFSVNQGQSTRGFSGASGILHTLVFYSPYLLSASVLALALLISYPSLRASRWLMVLAFVMMGYPLLARSLFVALITHQRHRYWSALNLGASAWQAFQHGWLPHLRPAIRTGLALALATMLGEFSATLFLSRPEWLTLSTLIYQQMGKIGDIHQQLAIVVAWVQLLLTLGVVGIIHRLLAPP